MKKNTVVIRKPVIFYFTFDLPKDVGLTSKHEIEIS